MVGKRASGEFHTEPFLLDSTIFFLIFFKQLIKVKTPQIYDVG